MTRVVRQKRFTISEIAADRHELTMLAAYYAAVRCARQWTIWTRSFQLSDIPPHQSATLGLHREVCKVLLISRPAEGRRMSWQWTDRPPREPRMRCPVWSRYFTLFNVVEQIVQQQNAYCNHKLCPAVCLSVSQIIIWKAFKEIWHY